MKRRPAALGFWVTLLMASSMAVASTPTELLPQEYGALTPGQGFTVAKGPVGDLNISAYLLVRYLNQLPGEQSFQDHLGVNHVIDTRNDIQLHREMLFFRGHVYDPKLGYEGMIWTVNSTAQVAVGGNINYRFSKAFWLFGGYGGLPGSYSITGVFPYFFGTDRQMADEFFRPSFTGGIWAQGDFPKLTYKVMVGNNLSQIGITAAQLTRNLATSAAVWWMPTTGEFGEPKPGFGDYEIHQKPATRFGVNYTHSIENRQSQPPETAPDNTQIRLSDSNIIFNDNALATGVTVNDVDYQMLALNAGVKYQGLHVQTEFYQRWLQNIVATGSVPYSLIKDDGYYVQAGYEVKPQELEIYLVHSNVLGMFNNSYEVGGGANFYPSTSRNWRINGHFLYVERSAASSLFGYYVGGQTGAIVSLATQVYF